MSENSGNSAEKEEEIKIESPEEAAEEKDKDKAAPEENPEKEDAPDPEGTQTPEKEEGSPEGDVNRILLEAKKKDAQIADLTDRYKRTLAEYENFRRRSEKEKSDIYTYAVKDVLTKILPVVDSLERGLSAIPEEEKDGAVARGMEKIYKQFEKVLGDIGVKPIEAEGKTFDPAFHNAVMHVDDESLGENVVAEDLQKGYMYKDSVIRHSMVKVAN